ncbi:DNA repair photolyase [Sphingobacterium allocomposti]|uniref:DNA repair photolyase n=1 Tax=Sphingobacterium allocomposti TaxID=415956 RepID=A0A5S5DQC7_9SPHI|nr:PA0069 family radical SAM protein [Sphingobacterium composti Yoo et al. 2007 non Ten et al. 2007]TYP97216.1 DNA repair photolyase [Sphingobacterium composti Yoo et al. 2007 non Ten et al. 2007]
MDTEENKGEYFKGRGAQVNPNNKFISRNYVQEHVEGLDEPFLESSPTQIIPTYPKQILSKVDSPDIGFYKSLNPYQGCEHGCIYCYARNSHEYWGYSAGLDFERKILVKYSAAELLRDEFDKKSYVPEVIFMSGNTDCYQPLERKLGLTRSILETMLAYKHPVSLISKNVLMLRDLDILAELASMGLVSVSVTINSLREEVRRKMEPRTATAKARLKLIERLAEKNVPVSLMIAPIVPAVNSDEMPALIKSGADAGAKWASYTIVRLNGSIADIFKDWAYKNYPDRAEKIIHGIEACHGGKLNDSQWGRRIRGDGQVAEGIRQLFKMAEKKYMGKEERPVLRTDLFDRPDSSGQLRLF